MYKLCVFAGTTEGRELVEFLSGQDVSVTACVATEYGETRLSPKENLTVSAQRLTCAAEADLSMVLYNPASHGRPDHLRKACEILLRVLPEDRPCAVAQYIGREGENRRFYTLGELQDAQVDMFCTVFIGNESTRMIGGNMVTPRGYRDV